MKIHFGKVLLYFCFTLNTISGINYDLNKKKRLEANAPFENITAVIQELTRDYDIRLRPNFGGNALEIGFDIIIASFDAVSEVNMDYTLTLYLNQYWQDERLAFGTEFFNSTLTLGADFAEKIWVPDTFFANDKHSVLHDVTEKNKVVKLKGDGSISYGMRFTTTLACMLNLEDYPMDVQNCTVEIESYGYTMSEVSMHWIDGDHAIRGIDRVDLPQFTLMDYKTVSTVERLQTGDYQRLSLSFRLRRNLGYFIFQTYLPSILIVMLSWISFWINHEATSARVALGITTVLTMTTISTAVRSSLPRISYVKAIDIYLLMCFLFVFSALIEFASVNYTYWGARTRDRMRRQKERRRKNKAAKEAGLDRFVSLLGRPGVPAGFPKLKITSPSSNVDLPRMDTAETTLDLPTLEGRNELKPGPSKIFDKKIVGESSKPKVRIGNDSSSEDDSLATASEGEIRGPCLAKLVGSCQSTGSHKFRPSSSTSDNLRISPLPGIGAGEEGKTVSDDNEDQTLPSRHFTNNMSHDELPSVRICSRVYGPGASILRREGRSQRKMFRVSTAPGRQPDTRRTLPRRFGSSASLSQSFRQMGDVARRFVSGEFVPTVQDVSKIDKLSRILFPTMFVLFNIAYWCTYLFGGIRGDDHDHDHLYG